MTLRGQEWLIVVNSGQECGYLRAQSSNNVKIGVSLFVEDLVVYYD